jgi:large subunit ribosomal protein L23
MRKTPYQVLQRPIITEKGLDVKEKARTLCFQVHHDATKVEIREAVQKIFKVRVASVHTANFPGKLRRRGRYKGYQADWKKAYVRLRSGEKMPEYAENI